MSRPARLVGPLALLTELTTGVGVPAQEPAPPPIVGQWDLTVHGARGD
jgi:hypothetical protein